MNNELQTKPEALPVVNKEITPMDMLQIAVEKGADLDKLEKLMALQDRWEANNARKAFVEAMNEFKSNPPDLIKTKTVKYGNTKYDHATLDNVSAIIGKSLSESGISHRWQTEQLGDGVVKVTCVLTHKLGHSESTALQAGSDTSGSKNDIQAIGSAITYLQRYTLLSAVGLATRDQDDDAKGIGGTQTITPGQKQELIDLLKEHEVETKPFLEYGEVSSIDEILAHHFEGAKAIILKRSKLNVNS